MREFQDRLFFGKKPEIMSLLNDIYNSSGINGTISIINNPKTKNILEYENEVYGRYEHGAIRILL